MVSFGSTAFVSVAKLGGAIQLDGENASNPLRAGQTIAAHGMFEDGSETDIGFFVVLKASSKHHTYDLAPLGCRDPYWGGHLAGKPSVSAKIMARANEKVGSTAELISRWRVVAEPKELPSPTSLEPLGKRGAEDAAKKWSFLSDYVVTEAEAGNESPTVM